MPDCQCLIGENTNLLPELARLDGVRSDHLLLLEVESLNVVSVRLLLDEDLLKLGSELGHLFLHVADDDGELLLLIL